LLKFAFPSAQFGSSDKCRPLRFCDILHDA
jgi:hypothetical protein